jgi:FAD/FMN-containing dehydrogenase
VTNDPRPATRNPQPATFESHLRTILGDAHVITDPDLKASYETDWTRRFSGSARAVVRPADAKQVAAVVRACAAEGIPIVPQGGNTGLVGGSIPRGGEVVLSLARLGAAEPVDTMAAQITIEAGVTVASLQNLARDAGLMYGVDLASRDSATVGGTIATNAGGLRVLRYGATRAQVIGIQAVLPNGEIIERMSGLTKDNTGYDLAGLLTGSEGTLGIVTRARLKLWNPPVARATALVALDSLSEAISLLGRVRGLASLDAIEAFFNDGMQLVCDHTGAPRPFPGVSGCYLVIECAAQSDPAEELASLLDGSPEVKAAAFATERPQREALWRYREAHTEAIGAAGVPHKLDVTLPLARMVEFEATVRAAVESATPGARAILFGHLGDGNLHVNVLGPADDDERADDAVLRLVASLGGSISAEHGIGVAKAPWLHLTRSPADIAAMRAIKAALDPQGIMNPGVIFGAQ